MLVCELTCCDVQQASCNRYLVGEAGHEQETNCLVTNYNLAFKREDKIPVARHPIVLM